MEARSVSVLLTGTFDEVWQRFRRRLVGLGQDEYRWEPVAGCWNVALVDGTWVVPFATRDPDPAPVTTIAWRLWHIASGCLASYTVRGFGRWPLAVSERQWYGRVDEALGALDESWDAFRGGVVGLGDDGMWTPLGDRWGPYAPEPWAALVVHALDEVTHHAAEVALLRDLYAHR